MTLLGRNTEVVGIENWSESNILGAWQENFEKLGVRSLLLCNTIGTGQQEQEEFITKKSRRSVQPT
ncbi:hypothetical protein [Okeania sp. KiyG1]|uniref:hypothetical protein n=1 Tax=Okeania sp. KiyG1 TaxID=2720165 RepID=UPI00192450D4|nr:hypothetical protein [Okeania sp. KiyG1]GGA35332.1 hypothetical protein CYANOKiyG1_52940 [Okeania sp. KiyG1]